MAALPMAIPALDRDVVVDARPDAHLRRAHGPRERALPAVGECWAALFADLGFGRRARGSFPLSYSSYIPPYNSPYSNQTE